LHTSGHTRKNSSFSTQDEHLGLLGLEALTDGLQPPLRDTLYLQTTLQENVALALNINTEKARSEMIIAPMLIEVRKILKKQVSLFSGVELQVDAALGLTGVCDYIISKSTNQVYVSAPAVMIVEAKNENIVVARQLMYLVIAITRPGIRFLPRQSLS
jgi:hydrogenase maturation factor HypE